MFIPHAMEDGTIAKFYDMVKFCSKLWVIDMPSGVDERIAFMGKSKVIKAPVRTNQVNNERVRNVSGGKRKVDWDAEECELCGKKHQPLSRARCRRCGNASHRFSENGKTCHANYDVCGQRINDRNKDGRKYLSYV